MHDGCIRGVRGVYEGTYQGVVVLVRVAGVVLRVLRHPAGVLIPVGEAGQARGEVPQAPDPVLEPQVEFDRVAEGLGFRA